MGTDSKRLAKQRSPRDQIKGGSKKYTFFADTYTSHIYIDVCIFRVCFEIVS